MLSSVAVGNSPQEMGLQARLFLACSLAVALAKNFGRRRGISSLTRRSSLAKRKGQSCPCRRLYFSQELRLGGRPRRGPPAANRSQQEQAHECAACSHFRLFLGVGENPGNL